MGILDFFKNILKEEQLHEEKKQKVNFSDIENWIGGKKKNIKEREKEVFNSVKDKIDNSLDDIKEKIKLFEDVDVDKKREKDRLKILSKEGQKKYSHDLKELVNNLENIRETDFNNLTKNITNIFLKFDKNSKKNYEKATILIGKEAGNTKDRVKKLSKDLVGIFKKNEDLRKISEKISIIESKLKNLDEIDEDIEVNTNNISGINKKSNEKENQVQNISNEIREVKESERYIERLNKIDEIKSMRKEIDQDISNLRKLVDFKKLGDFYHTFDDEIKIVKEYKENFKNKFFENSGKDLLRLLKEANMKIINIENEINKINDKIKEVEKKEKDIANSKDDAKILSSQKNKIEKEVENLKGKIPKEKKKLEKKRKNRKEIVNDVKKEMEDLGARIVFKQSEDDESDNKENIEDS